jgi:hyperosmotically inducible periplasmic protein
MKQIPLVFMTLLVLGGSAAVESCKNKKATNTTEQSKPESNVQVNDDQTLRSSVNDVVKNYNDVTAEVENGVVTLKGSIKRDDLQNLIMKIQELKPKKVENKLVIK